jgi:hypothetical protein
MQNRWLKNVEAAEALTVSVRTVKGWMKCPAKREALGAVRAGKQWRIPRPDEMWHWEDSVRRNFKDLGIELKDSWESGWEKLGKEFARYELESYRLWLAAYMNVLQRDNITQEARDGILLLWQTACKILGKQPKGTEVDTLKSEFPDQLRSRNFSEERIRAIMQYWPEDRLFKKVRDASTLKQLEAIRRPLDTLQATRDLEQNGQKPTAKNLRPLFHKNIMEHINDTRDELPGIVVKNPTGEEMHLYTMASVQDQMTGKTPPLVTFDLREPQNGLALRTFRKRHPLKKSPQREIVAEVYGVRDSIPGTDERPHSGKTPVRDSEWPTNERGG